MRIFGGVHKGQTEAREWGMTVIRSFISCQAFKHALAISARADYRCLESKK